MLVTSGATRATQPGEVGSQRACLFFLCACARSLFCFLVAGQSSPAGHLSTSGPPAPRGASRRPRRTQSLRPERRLARGGGGARRGEGSGGCCRAGAVGVPLHARGALEQAGRRALGAGRPGRTRVVGRERAPRCACGATAATARGAATEDPQVPLPLPSTLAVGRRRPRAAARAACGRRARSRSVAWPRSSSSRAAGTAARAGRAPWGSRRRRTRAARLARAPSDPVINYN